MGNPWLRRQRANASSAAICAGVRAVLWFGGPPPGSRCWQADAPDLNAGDWSLKAVLNSRGEVVGSGKFGTPCERMQSEKLTASCCAWAVVGWPSVVDELGELEPQAAIAVATAIAATTAGRHELSLDMTQVVAG